jgi:tetratricopeptide (TPR) repeat protein
MRFFLKSLTNAADSKSQLAIEYSYQFREQSPDTWVFWVHASNTARFEESYRNIAERVKMPDWNNPDVNTLRLVDIWLRDEANGKWLMIVDNADDATVFSYPVSTIKKVETSKSPTSEATLLEFLPQSQNGAILVTSRSRDVAFSITGDTRDIIRVDPMDKGLAVDLLRKKLPDNFDENDAKELVHALDYMPLAISQAAAFISQRAPQTSVSKYLQDIQSSDVDRAKLLSKAVADTRRDGRASNSIITTWQISFENINRERPSAARLLSLMCLFDRQGIPKSLIEDGYQKEEQGGNFDDDIYTLSSYSLIGINVEATEFEMHRLVQFSTKTWLELKGELEAWKGVFIEIIYEKFPKPEYENWEMCQKLFPHTQEGLSYRPLNEEHLESWASVSFDAASFSVDMGHYEIAGNMYKAAINAYKELFGPEHVDVLTATGNLANVYRKKGDEREAEELLKTVLELEIKNSGPEHDRTLSTMNDLALTYLDQGRFSEAEKLQQTIMEMRIKISGPEHSYTLIAMHNLASTYRKQSRPEEAEELQVRVLEAEKRLWGENNPNTLMAMCNLALIYLSLGRLKEAEELQTKELDIATKTLGTEHPQIMAGMDNLAIIYWDQGRLKEAADLQEHVLKMKTRVLGEQHPITLSTMYDLAITYQSQGRFGQAMELQEKEFQLCSRVRGAEHFETLLSMENLALIWKDCGRESEAVELLEQCVILRKKVLGVDHRETIGAEALLRKWQTEMSDTGVPMIEKLQLDER